MSLTYEELVKRLGALAIRRYGGNTSETRRKVLEDGAEWLMDKVKRGNCSTSEMLQIIVIHYCPIRWIRYKMIVKLCWYSYFEGVVIQEEGRTL